MPIKETQDFLVIRKIKTADESLVVKALCSDDVTRTFIVKGVAKNKANVLLSHFSFVSGEVTKSKFSTISQASRLEATLPLKNIKGDLNRNLMALYLCDLLDKVLKEGTSEEGLYLWIKSQAELLDSLERNYFNMHLCFLRELCAKLGYELTREAFLPFIQESPDTLKVLEFITLPFEKAMVFPFTGKARTAFCHDVQKYLSAYTDSPIVCQSLDIIAGLY